MQLMDLFVIHNTFQIFHFDATIFTRPMTYYVEDPDQISNLFDSVAYEKCKPFT